MVSEDSGLYRAHPDWALGAPGRPQTRGRSQLALDFTRQDVRDYVYASLRRVLDSADISYIKWDMNRALTDVWSAALPAERQGEVFHRYVLGVYSFLEQLRRDYPKLFIEGCAGGGGRFDAGMLYYTPQIWASDNTDAIDRLKIQYGTSFCYPISSIGAHVSAVPNHQLGRITPLSTRGNAACFGAFGYELDLNRLTGEERELVREQIAFVKEYRQTLQFGDFYRLLSPFEGNFTAWMAVSPDRRTALVGWYKTLNEVNGPYRRVKLRGLDPDLAYTVDGGAEHYGDELMRVGLTVSDAAAGESEQRSGITGDFASHIFVVKSV